MENFKSTGMTIVTPKIDFKNHIIELDVVEKMNNVMVNRYKEILDLREKMVRDALIKLGWTPPGDMQRNAERFIGAKLILQNGIDL